MRAMEKTDEMLVTEYLSGDERAFAQLIKRHLRGVYSFALRSAGGEADDIVQDIFLKVWKNLKRYEPQSARFKTWLMRIARNTVIDYLRKKKSFTFSDLEDGRDDSRLGNVPDPEPLPDEVFARAHDIREVQSMLEKLPPLYREVLLLHYMNHLSFEEISSILDVPANTVRSRHHRGLLRLRNLLTELHRKGV